MVLSRLLLIPAEIRSLIYEYAVTSEKTVVTFRLDSYQRETYSQANQPALTRVSRQVRSESLPIYYESNDFVLHTEIAKAEEAQRWLRCNQTYLGVLRRLSLWLRHVPPLTNHHQASSQGAISVSITRSRKNDPWRVDEQWKWITVVRKPAGLDEDAQFILEKLGGRAREIQHAATSDEYVALMTDLRLLYVQEKMSR